MKNLLIIVLITLSIISANSFAASGAFSGSWTLTLDKSLDNIAVSDYVYSIDMNSHHNSFTAEYTGINNDSFFDGQTFYDPARSTTLIHIVQVDQTFYRIFSGKKTGTNTYVGTWYDNAGQSGDFKIYK